MITDALRAKIRRLFFAEHWKIGTIAAELGVNHETVHHAVESRSFLAPVLRARAEMLDPYRDFILVTLEQHPRLRATRLHEMLRDRGYKGSVFPVRRFVARKRPSRHEAFLRLSVLPGEQAQVDWASFGSIVVGRAKRGLSCFLMVLSWSRALFARFYLDQTTESFLRGHVAAFEAFGGVPRTILYDNLKSAVLEREGELIRFHPRILELAGHYHFAPKPCAVARGNEKGRVERRVRDLREAFFAARPFRSLDDLNAQLDTWIDGVQRARLVPSDLDKRLVRDALTEERARLLPLPEHRAPTDLLRATASGKTPYIRFDRNDYSIPHTHVRKTLSVVASGTLVRVLDGVNEIARHARSYDAGQQLEDERHLAALTADKRKAREHRGKNRLFAVCPAAKAFLGEIALHGGHLGGTTSRLLRLLDSYGEAALDAAILDAHERGAFRAESVAHVLDQRRRADGQKPVIIVALSDDPRVRDQVVQPPPRRLRQSRHARARRRCHMSEANLHARLCALGLHGTADGLDDIVALATKKRWGPTQIFEHVADIEERERSRRGLERRLSRSHLGRFKTIADYDWNWPTKIDRPLGESAVGLQFLGAARNVVLVAPQGLGKTMIAQNIAHQAIVAGHSVLFTTAAQMLLDLGGQESSRALERRLRHYAKQSLLVLDEVGYLAFDNRNADLLFQVVSRRYERKSLVLTTNLAFKDWASIFPNATCATALIDRVIHHADVISIEGKSYRLREAEDAAANKEGAKNKKK